MSARMRLVAAGWDQDLQAESEWARTALSPDMVRVSVEACGVCHRDIIDRDGRFPFMRLPITPGHEAAGRVVECGTEVRDFRPGDRVATMHRDFCGSCSACKSGSPSQCEVGVSVFGLTIDGGYATELCAPATCFYPLPADLSGWEAATLHCTFGTAYRGLVRLGVVAPGQHVLVTGANGGVGSAAVQLAKRLGAKVTGVIRDHRYEDYVEGLGADQVIVDSDGRFHKQMAAAADVGLECVGPATFNATLRSVRAFGCVVVIGNVSAERPELNLGYLVTKGLRLFGSSGASREDMQEVLALHRAEPFSLQLERVPLVEADSAQRRLRAGGVRGRLVLDVL